MPRSQISGEGIYESVKVHAAEVSKALFEGGCEGGGIVAGVCCCLGVPWRHAQKELGQMIEQALGALVSGCPRFCDHEGCRSQEHLLESCCCLLVVPARNPECGGERRDRR